MEEVAKKCAWINDPEAVLYLTGFQPTENERQMMQWCLRSNNNPGDGSDAPDRFNKLQDIAAELGLPLPRLQFVTTKLRDGIRLCAKVIDRLRSIIVNFDAAFDALIKHDLEAVAEDRTEKAVSLLPSLTRIVYPRVYRVPDTHASPKILLLPAALAAWSSCTFTRLGLTIIESETDASQASWNLEEKADKPAFKMVCALAQKRVPTYFVGKDMAVAITMSDLPKDFSLANLQWPIDALLFHLPRGVVSSPSGSILSVAVVRLNDPVYQLSGFEFNSHYKDILELRKAEHTGDECRVMAISETGQTYLWGCPIDETDILTSSTVHPSSLMSDPTDDEKDFIQGVLPGLGLKLLLTMIACPDRVEKGKIHTPQEKKRGYVTKEAVWHPNFFGKNYVMRRSDPDPNAPPGTKKRMHWRRGHYRGQRYGAGNALVKVMWIEAVLING